jgi:hypothetical protein
MGEFPSGNVILAKPSAKNQLRARRRAPGAEFLDIAVAGLGFPPSRGPPPRFATGASTFGPSNGSSRHISEMMKRTPLANV